MSWLAEVNVGRVNSARGQDAWNLVPASEADRMCSLPTPKENPRLNSC